MWMHRAWDTYILRSSTLSTNIGSLEIPPIPARPDWSCHLTDNARTVLTKRYLIRDADGRPLEEPEDMFWRVAWTVASNEIRYGGDLDVVTATAEAFYRMMIKGLWLPNSPTLMNAGRPLGQLSACFVLPVDDALTNGGSGIYDTLRSMAMVHQSGGGTGFSFSRLRPSGALVRSTTGVASGPVSFMKLYDASTNVVKQGGTRRGANMGILRVDHPDIEEFIGAKEDLSNLVNFNISVALTDSFMAAVAAGQDYDLREPGSGRVVGKLDARLVFDRIVKNAWRTGEPGVFFVDEANRYNPVPALGAYEATNPCGEQPLLPYDVCNLGSLNLGLFVQDGDGDWRGRVDWEGIRDYTNLSTRFLDNVIDLNHYPLPEVENLSKRIRRIGNGPMGFADMLVRLGIPYGSDESLEVADLVADAFHEGCLAASQYLAEVRGVFPEWEASIWGPDATCARAPDGSRVRPMIRLRNCNVNTVAPTGTISIIAGCSSGIEPLFAVAFMRNQAGSLMPDINPDFAEMGRRAGWGTPELMERIATTGHLHHPEIPVEVQQLFTTAHDVTPRSHVLMQAAWQRHVDSAISKTTNFPREATVEDVREVYLLAHSLGCKGVTVYRDGSREGQVLSTGATTASAPEKVVDEGDMEALLADNARLRADLAALERGPGADGLRARPGVLHGYTEKIETMFGSMYVTVNSDESGRPFEVFGTLGNAGGPVMADIQAMSRLISMALRANVPMRSIHKQLRGIATENAVGFGRNKVLSVPDGIGQVLERHMKRMEGIQETLALGSEQAPLVESPLPDDVLMRGGQCRDCHAVGSLEIAEGCLKCHACGSSACS